MVGVTHYDVYKILHLLGVVVLMGNVTITAFWKVFADRTGDPRIIAFGQRLVTATDWVFTLGGIVLIYAGGIGAMLVGGFDFLDTSWLVWGQVLFAVSGLIWLVVLVPVQIRQARQARDFAQGGEIPGSYRALGRRWLAWGIIATLPLLAAVWVMVAKP